MSIFLIEYTNDSPYRQNVEIWVRSNPDDIYEVLMDLKWLEEKEFRILSTVPGKKGCVVHHRHHRGDKIFVPKKLLKNMQQYESYDIEVRKLYICNKCETYYVKRQKCCGNDKKVLEKIVL